MVAYDVGSPPHIHSEDSVPKRMWTAAAALFPFFLVTLIFFTGSTVRIFFAALAGGLLSELIAKIILRQKGLLQDGNTFLLVLVFALLLPPGTPELLAFLGSLAAILLGKSLLGGLGAYPLHPALLGVVFLHAGFPQWFQETASTGAEEILIVAALLGGAVLIWQKLIYWEVPVLYLLVCVTAALGLHMDWRFMLTGQIVLVAFFVVTESSTTPTTRAGHRIFAVLAAVLAALLRDLTGNLFSFVPAVLIMNACTPWIDEWVRPQQAKAPK